MEQNIDQKINHYRAKLEATRRQLDVVKTTLFKAKTAARKITWPHKPPTDRMRLLLKLVILNEKLGSKFVHSYLASPSTMGPMPSLRSTRTILQSQTGMV